MAEQDEKLLEDVTDKWSGKSPAYEKNGTEKSTIDFQDKFTLFVDANLRVIRTIPWVVGAVGVLIIVRRTHVFTIFKKSSDIPREYIKKNLPLRGRVVGICEDNSLKVQHLPLLWKSRVPQVSGGDYSNCLDVSLGGVRCRKGVLNG